MAINHTVMDRYFSKSLLVFVAASASLLIAAYASSAFAQTTLSADGQQTPINSTEVIPPLGQNNGNEAKITSEGEPAVKESPSRLEMDYRARLETIRPRTGTANPLGAVPLTETLDQFGYNTLSLMSAPTGGLTLGGANDRYVLGVGDEVVVTLRGLKSVSYRARVDREGRVILPEFAPIAAAGRTFGTFRNDIEIMAASALARTDVYVSLGTVRQISVFVLGEVNSPGIHQLSGLSSVLQGIITAGGVKKTGSLRQIKLIRNNQALPIDLYSLFLTGRLPGDVALTDGDRIMVPTLGPTVAIGGEVRRPGIFELTSTSEQLSMKQAIRLAGGFLRPSGYRHVRITPDAHGRDVLSEAVDPDVEAISDGDILLAIKSQSTQVGSFRVEGHVAVPGIRSLGVSPTLKSLLSGHGLFKESPYLLFAAIQRTDEKTMTRHFIAADLARVRDGDEDVRLATQDRVIVFGLDDIRYLSSVDVQNVLQGKPPSNTESCGGLKSLARLVAGVNAERFSMAVQAINANAPVAASNAAPCPQVFDAYPELLAFALDHVVSLQGESRSPGAYPVVADVSLATLVAASAGFSSDADLSNIELSRFSADIVGRGLPVERRAINANTVSLLDVRLSPGDIVRINPAFTNRGVGNVTLAGEVRRPGLYNIHRGESLSVIIARAGGLTDQAYPLAAVMTRESVKAVERQNFLRAARDTETALAEALTGSQFQGNSQGAIAALQGLANTLRNTEPVGRVVVEANPAELLLYPELDVMLSSGDKIYMPKRMNHVTVTGEVLHGGAQQFRSGSSVTDYINKSGGMSQTADSGRVFVILPNGTSRPVSAASWNFASNNIPPGSTIVVPRDPAPFNLRLFIKDFTEIISKLAITAASLAVISN